MNRRAPEGVRRIVFLNWRDTRNPEGGGSERYVENIARSLAERGHDVTIFCAAHGAAPADEVRDGVRFVRRGGKLSVYLRAALHHARRGFGRPDVMIDVHNGVPFLARAWFRGRVVVLVHHVHREQWPVVYGARMARTGWWVESRLAPWVNRRTQYVAVSRVTKGELAALGIDPAHIAVVHNGTTALPAVDVPPSSDPRVCVLGRLVPHKRVEHALEAVARLADEWPTLTLSVVGDGYWAGELRDRAAALGIADRVEFTGQVDEEQKAAELARAWVLAVPSLKEGWGLVVMEAATHGVPAVGYRASGGLAESVVDGATGLLADDRDEFAAALRRLLADEALRRRLGDAARDRAYDYSWERAAGAFAGVLDAVLDGQLTAAEDLVELPVDDAAADSATTAA